MSQKMMAEKVTPYIFNPPHHTSSNNIQHNLDVLLKEYESQFAKDETSIGTTPLTSMTINTGNSDPVSQKPYPICYETLSMGKGGNRKTTCSQGHLQ